MKSSTPASSAIALAVSGLSASDHHHPQAHLAKPGESFGDSRLQDIFKLDHADQSRILGDGQRRGPLRGDGVDLGLIIRGNRPAERLNVARHGVGAPLCAPWGLREGRYRSSGSAP